MCCGPFRREEESGWYSARYWWLQSVWRISDMETGGTLARARLRGTTGQGSARKDSRETSDTFMIVAAVQ